MPTAPAEAWFVDKVLEHRIRGIKKVKVEFRVKWKGLPLTDRRHKKWHPLEIFRTEGVDGLIPGEVSCTLIDDKVGAYMKKAKIAKWFGV